MEVTKEGKLIPDAPFQHTLKSIVDFLELCIDNPEEMLDPNDFDIESFKINKP